MDRNVYLLLVEKLVEEIKTLYGSRLVTFAIFGSFARNEMRSDSDLDILTIAEDIYPSLLQRNSGIICAGKAIILDRYGI